MKPTHMRLAAVVAGLALVTACGGGGSVLDGMTRLGSTFQQAFAQGANDEPVDVSNADLVLTLTQDPFEL
ncbi:MAG: hypothetical protein AAFS01_00410 [Pseudomonadota bacterium]